jgi:hypothetical protein
MSPRRLLAVGLLACVVLLPACGKKPSPQPSLSSGVHGILLIAGGPAVGIPSPLPDGFGTTKLGRPYDAVIEVRAKTGAKAGEVVFKVRRTPNGLFMVTLPPGTYVLTPLVPKHGPWSEPKTVVVKPGAYTRTILYLQGM